MRTWKDLKSEHPVVARLKTEDGGWADPHNVATTRFEGQAIEYLASHLSHLANGNGEAYAAPECIQLWLGIDFPLEDAIDFRMLGANAVGIWIDSGEGRRIGSRAVLIPWTSVFAVHIYSEKNEKKQES